MLNTGISGRPSIIDDTNIDYYNSILASNITIDEYLTQLNSTTIVFIKQNKRLNLTYNDMLFVNEAVKLGVPFIMPIWNSRKILNIYALYFGALSIGQAIGLFIGYKIIRFLQKQQHIMSAHTYKMHLHFIQLLIIQV